MSEWVYECVCDKLCVCVCVGGQLLGRKISTMCHIVMVTIRRAINTSQICCIRDCPAVCVCVYVLCLLDIFRLPSMSERHSLLSFFASHSHSYSQAPLPVMKKNIMHGWVGWGEVCVWGGWRVGMAKRLFICQKINVFSLLASFPALTRIPLSLFPHFVFSGPATLFPLPFPLATVWPTDTKRYLSWCLEHTENHLSAER